MQQPNSNSIGARAYSKRHSSESKKLAISTIATQPASAQKLAVEMIRPRQASNSSRISIANSDSSSSEPTSPMPTRAAAGTSVQRHAGV